MVVSLRSIALVSAIICAADHHVLRVAEAFASPVVLTSRQGQLSLSSSFTGKIAIHDGGNKLLTRSGGNNARTPATQLSMAIERMSNDCVAAIQKAHSIGKSIGLKTLKNEVIFVGIVANPERAARTLQRYKLDDYDEIEMSAIKTLTFKKEDLNPDPGFNDDNLNEPLPFSDEARILLTKACTIADRLEAPNGAVRSEHVLLALLGYDNGKKIETVPTMDLLRTIPALKKVNTETGGFTVTQFCSDLVNALPMTPISGAGDDLVVKDTVVVGGSKSAAGSTSTLNDVGVDLTQMAVDGKLDTVFGRDQEIRSALRTLGRRRKNNPCLIGDPGVGKTAIAEGVAQVLANGLMEMQNAQKASNPISNLGSKIGNFVSGGKKDLTNGDSPVEDNKEEDFVYNLPPCPASLMGARVISIDLAGLVAGTSNRGDFEKRMKNLIKEASENNVILFVDEIHNLIGTGGGGDGAMNAANLLKPALARGELRLMGATTTPEYRKYIEKDGALERRFQPLVVQEPTVYETLDILGAISPKYEEFHGVKYTYNGLVAAAKLSNRYINDRFLPDKAIDMIDEAGSMVKMAEDGETYYVTEDSIQTVVAEITGIPVGKLDTGEKKRLMNLEEELEKRIKGQNTAVRSVAKAIRRARSGMRDGKRPVASLLFCGPTGVGKTELCKSLAETYYGEEKSMVRIDMSEYMDRFSSSRLIGAPPGYVGYEEGGQLTEAVRRNPHSVILFDELEKAHEDVLNLLLQVMDEGTLTDGKGRTVSFKNNIFVMTSNVGSKNIIEAARSMSQEVEDESQLTADVVKAALEEAMRPEFLNRIDEIIVFSPLPYEQLKEISRNLIDNTVKRVADDSSITLKVSDNIAEVVTREAMAGASIYGARPIRRAVQRYLEDTMAEAIMSDFIQEGDSATVNLKDPNSGKYVVEIRRELDGESCIIDVDENAGISKESLDYSAAYGEVPNLDEPPEQEPGAFQ